MLNQLCRGGPQAASNALPVTPRCAGHLPPAISRLCNNGCVSDLSNICIRWCWRLGTCYSLVGAQRQSPQTSKLERRPRQRESRNHGYTTVRLRQGRRQRSLYYTGNIICRKSDVNRHREIQNDQEAHWRWCNSPLNFKPLRGIEYSQNVEWLRRRSEHAPLEQALSSQTPVQHCKKIEMRRQLCQQAHHNGSLNHSMP